MPDLSRLHRWEKYVPNLGENRSLENPFYLEIASSLSKQEYTDFMDRWGRVKEKLSESEEDPAKAAEAFVWIVGDTVRLGSEPLSIQGKPITDLKSYFEAVLGLAGTYNIHEMLGVIARFNSVEGTRELFYEQASGGSFFTASPKTGKAGGQKADR